MQLDQWHADVVRLLLVVSMLGPSAVDHLLSTALAGFGGVGGTVGHPQKTVTGGQYVQLRRLQLSDDLWTGSLPVGLNRFHVYYCTF